MTRSDRMNTLNRRGPRSGNTAPTIQQLEERKLLTAFAATELFATDAVAQGPAAAIESDTVLWGGGRVSAIQGQWLLTFDDALGLQGAADKAAEVASLLGIDATSTRAVGASGRYAVLNTDANIPETVAWNAPALIEGLRYFEPDFTAHQTASIPNDPFFANQYYLDNVGQLINGVPGTAGADIGIVDIWDTTVGSSDVVIAVIDTGVDMDHPDLIQNIWVNPGEIPGNGIDDDGNGFVDDVNGFDFGELDNNPDDVEGHGTAVAGTLGATGNNGIGIAGVNWDVSILPLKIADNTGSLVASAIVGSHDYLTDLIVNRGINVVASNNSYGAFQPAFFLDNFPDGFQAEQDAIERFIATGAAFVAAAGNDATNN
ncbi:MAG: S8 family serine peptidase, partial [Planctomycetota bacterium]